MESGGSRRRVHRHCRQPDYLFESYYSDIDFLRSELELMMKMNKKALQEKEELIKEKDHVKAKYNVAMADIAHLVKEKKKVIKEAALFIKEKDEKMAKEKEEVVEENAMLTKQMLKERQKMIEERKMVKSVTEKTIKEMEDAKMRCEEAVREKERVIKEKEDAEVKFRAAMAECREDKEEVYNKALEEIEEQIKVKRAVMRENQELMEANKVAAIAFYRALIHETKNKDEINNELENAMWEIESLQTEKDEATIRFNEAMMENQRDKEELFDKAVSETSHQIEEKQNAMREVKRLTKENEQTRIRFNKEKEEAEIRLSEALTENERLTKLIGEVQLEKSDEASIQFNASVKEIEAAKARETEEIERDKKMATQAAVLADKLGVIRDLRVLVKEMQEYLLLMKNKEDAEKRFNEAIREKKEIEKINDKQIQNLKEWVDMLYLDIGRERKAAMRAAAKAQTEALERAIEVEKRAAVEAERNAMEKKIKTLRGLVTAAEQTARREAEFAAALMEAEYEIVD